MTTPHEAFNWIEVAMTILGLILGGGFSVAVVVIVVRADRKRYSPQAPDVASLEHYRTMRARKYEAMHRMRKVARQRRGGR